MFTLLSGRFVHEAESGRGAASCAPATRPPRSLAEVAPDAAGARRRGRRPRAPLRARAIAGRPRARCARRSTRRYLAALRRARLALRDRPGAPRPDGVRPRRRSASRRTLEAFGADRGYGHAPPQARPASRPSGDPTAPGRRRRRPPSGDRSAVADVVAGRRQRRARRRRSSAPTLRRGVARARPRIPGRHRRARRPPPPAPGRRGRRSAPAPRQARPRGAAACLVVAGTPLLAPRASSARPVRAARAAAPTTAPCVAAAGGAPAICRRGDGACVALASEDCQVLSEPGDVANDATVWVGAMFPLSGADARATAPTRCDSVDLARRDFAEVGGGPAAGAPRRPPAPARRGRLRRRPEPGARRRAPRRRPPRAGDPRLRDAARR